MGSGKGFGGSSIVFGCPAATGPAFAQTALEPHAKAARRCLENGLVQIREDQVKILGVRLEYLLRRNMSKRCQEMGGNVLYELLLLLHSILVSRISTRIVS